MIFVNHVPGMDYSILTMRNYAISDAAELFVFLAGCSLALVSNGVRAAKPLGQVAMRLFLRTFEIWQAQIVVTSVALAMLGIGAIALEDPLLLEWHNAGPAFVDTVRASVGMVLLTYQIGYFNILPLYVVLLLLAIPFIVIARVSLVLAIAASLALYAATLAFEIELPSWPVGGAWFFNPLSWQVLIVAGYLAIAARHRVPRWQTLLDRAWPFAVAFVILGAAIVWVDYRPDPMLVPEPRYFYLFDKAYLSPVRIVSMMAVAIAFYPAFPVLSRKLGSVVRYCSALGRNSLAVFCMASLLALGGQIIRYATEPTFLIDTAIVVTGLITLRVTAWLSEFQSSAS